VLGDVRQRLLHEAVDRRLQLRIQRRLVDGHVENDLEPFDLAHPPGEALERRDEPELVERRRSL
jgi:hypothetical protein